MGDLVERAIEKLDEDIERSSITETDSFEEARKTVKLKHKIIEELTLDEDYEIVDVETLEERLEECNLELHNGQVYSQGNSSLTYDVGQEAYNLVSQDKHPFLWLKDIDSETEELVELSIGVRSIREKN